MGRLIGPRCVPAQEPRTAGRPDALPFVLVLCSDSPRQRGVAEAEEGNDQQGQNRDKERAARLPEPPGLNDAGRQDAHLAQIPDLLPVVDPGGRTLGTA